MYLFINKDKKQTALATAAAAAAKQEEKPEQEEAVERINEYLSLINKLFNLKFSFFKLS